VKRIVFALVLFAVLVNAAPALADDPRLMREDAPSFAPAPYYEEPHTNHKPAKIAAPPAPFGSHGFACFGVVYPVSRSSAV
jgi:hypothetical protein